MTSYYMGQGKVYAALRGIGREPQGFRLLGNCTRLDISLGRGGMNRENRGSAPQPLLRVAGSTPRFNLDMESIEQKNLALLLHGESTTVAGASGVANIIARKGLVVPLPHINLTSFTALRNAADTATYDPSGYSVNLAAGSIEFAASSAIPDNTVVIAKYEHGGHTYTGAFTNKPEFMALRYEGVNTVENYAPVVLDLFKIKFDPMDSLQLINDNFLSLQTQGKIYYDDMVFDSKAEGKYLRIRQL